MSRTGSRQEMPAFRDYSHHHHQHQHRSSNGGPQMVVGGTGGAHPTHHHSLMRGQMQHIDMHSASGSSVRSSSLYGSHPQLSGSNPQLYRGGNQVTGGGSHPPSLNGFPQGPGPSRHQAVIVGHHPYVNGGHPNMNGGYPHMNGGHQHVNGGLQPSPMGAPGGRPPPESEQNRALREAFRREMKLESYLADDLNFPDFANKLKEQGLQLRDIPADGNCLFRALGDQLEGHCRNHYRHRQEVVGYIVDHRKDFEPFLEDEMPFDTHVTNLKKLGTHAGNDAIVAFARLHNVNVFIHQLKGDPLQISAPSSNVNVRQVHIAYHNGDHYSSVRCLGDNTESPANVRIQKSEELPAPVSTPSGEDGGKGVVTAKREVSHLEAEVCRATGCQDTMAVRKALKLNAYDVDETIASLMHSLEIGGTQVGDDTTSVGSHQTTDSGIFASTHITGGGSCTGSVKGKGHKVHFREDSLGGSSGYSSMGSNRGGSRPMLFIPQAPVQYIVTGRKAKELKKMQKQLKYI